MSGSQDRDDRLLAFADRLRQGESVEVEDIETPETWVSFVYDQQSFALPVEQVLEVAPLRSLTTVPGSPAGVSGVSSLRGHSIAVVELARVLGVEPPEIDNSKHILVIDRSGRSIGLAVDKVQRVFKLLASKVQEVEALDLAYRKAALRGSYDVDGSSVVLLDTDFLSPLEHAQQ